mgnify:CR=1 FL=1|tara:strand:+ start:492 stop:1676 length:1185 start_codon:yes stop_codon:yes gene_type:complete
MKVVVPNIPDLVSNLTEILESGWLTQGKYCESFESLGAKMAGTKYAVACTNATTGLDLVLRTMDPGIVLLPTNTHFATLLAVENAGHRPLLVDVDKYSLMMTVSSVQETYKFLDFKEVIQVRAIIYVSIGGNLSPDILQLKSLCSTKGIDLIEDCAHSHGSKVWGSPIADICFPHVSGGIGYAGVFSYYPTKVAFGSEGGLITTNNQRLYEQLQRLKWFGRTDHTSFEDSYSFLGLNAVMGDIQACICAHTTALLPSAIEARKSIALRYDSVLKERHKEWEIYFPHLRDDHLPNYYKYIITHHGTCDYARDALRVRLRDEGFDLEMPVFNPPLHSQPYVVKRHRYFTSGQEFPEADWGCKNHSCIPINPAMTSSQVDKVCQALEIWQERDLAKR